MDDCKEFYDDPKRKKDIEFLEKELIKMQELFYALVDI